MKSASGDVMNSQVLAWIAERVRDLLSYLQQLG
jgi:hypothetical protein